MDLRRPATQARAVAASLIAAGVRPADRVAILMANRPEAVASFFGAAMAGAVVAPLSTFSTAPELAQLLALADPAVLLAQTVDGRARFCEPTSRRELASSGRPDRSSVGRDWDAFLAEGAGVAGQTIDAAEAAVDVRIPTAC